MKISNITTLPDNPEHERRQRMRKYAIMMGIRIICIAFLPFVHGWWLLVFALGAVFLPYLAVVVANSVDERRTIPESPRALPFSVDSAPPSSPDVRSTGNSKGQRYYYDYDETDDADKP
ncbi:MAG: DUF3099 domain-containing protein [Microbacteriaceae bacterium]